LQNFLKKSAINRRASFRRTSSEVCKMIIALDDLRRTPILKRHIARIDDSRLRRAFHAAVDVERKLAPPVASKAGEISGPVHEHGSAVSAQRFELKPISRVA
jgi:hypothetical protein